MFKNKCLNFSWRLWSSRLRQTKCKNLLRKGEKNSKEGFRSLGGAFAQSCRADEILQQLSPGFPLPLFCFIPSSLTPLSLSLCPGLLLNPTLCYQSHPFFLLLFDVVEVIFHKWFEMWPKVRDAGLVLKTYVRDTNACSYN